MAVGRERGMIVCTLDAVMKARGIKGKDLARTVGMSEVNLSRVKRGKARMVKLVTLEAICRELRCVVETCFSVRKEIRDERGRR